MKYRIRIVLLLTLLISACGSKAASSTQAALSVSGDSTTSSNASTTAVAGTQAPLPSANSRQVKVSEIQNDVQVSTQGNANFLPAQNGMIVQVGGTVKTGDNSRARIDLLPEGTIVRVASNSLFTVKSIETVDGKPQTKLQLFLGKVWVLLAGGQLDVETETGVASVRGSLLSVEYDSDAKHLNVSCLEGDCGLKNENGDEVDLTDGQECNIDESGDISDVEQMSDDQLQEWVNENPDASDYFDGDIPDWLPEPDPEYNPLDDSTGVEATSAPEIDATSAPEATEAPVDNSGGVDNPSPDDGSSDPPPDDGSGGGSGG